jgi:ribosome biogenesis SPOUT family RNA methylase Rps3
MLYVIEHLEEKLTKWVLLEYEHASEFLGEKLLITNLKKEEEKIIRLFARTNNSSIIEIVGEKPVIVLDPDASIPLRPSDTNLSDVIVIGGIMGDYPRKKRTKKLLTSRIKNPIPRNIGEGQYSVDGAIAVAYMVLDKGRELGEIPYIDNYKIVFSKQGIETEIVLPYRYPIINGKIFFSSLLRNFLVKGVEFEENNLNG